jgi:hypothetical protein
VSLLLCLNFIQTEPEHIVRDNSTVGVPSSGLKKPNHCSNGIPVIPKSDSTGIILNGHINGLAIKNHVNGHHSHIAEDAVRPGDGHREGRGRETVDSRGRSRERHSPVSHRGEERVIFIVQLWAS